MRTLRIERIRNEWFVDVLASDQLGECWKNVTVFRTADAARRFVDEHRYVNV